MTNPIQGIGQQLAQIGQDIGSREIDVLGGSHDGGFASLLGRALGEVSGSQDAAQDLMTRFANGEQVELHDVMAATEEASITLEMLVEVRNKFADAYRTLINMQG
jgi:flagellar hook-basal body complex protein FliE